MSEFSYTTKALYSGEKVCGMDLSPETIPCFLTTAFTMRGFKEVQDTYANKGYTYVRTRNPNRTALGEVISCLDRAAGEVVLTGRDPDPALVGRADYITEMGKLRHPFDLGTAARPGVEY